MEKYRNGQGLSNEDFCGIKAMIWWIELQEMNNKVCSTTESRTSEKKSR